MFMLREEGWGVQREIPEYHRVTKTANKWVFYTQTSRHIELEGWTEQAE